MGYESPDGFGSIPTFFLWFFWGVVALMLCIVVLTVVSVVRNRRVLREAGIDPGTAGAQLTARLIRGQLSGRPTAASRLAELDDLRNRGLITAEEYAARRAQIIDGI
ncbi:MAG: SHOCT domain-containing protein [Actinobacteria bacterium]|nr:SHOCT domain-containing protein [Actinomycetota bacterium]